MSTSLQAVVLAAGKGVRFKSKFPKVLHNVCGLSLLERVLRSVSELRPARIIVVVGHGEELVRAELEKIQKHPLLKNIELKVAVQREQKGTGHAVQMSLPELDAQIPHVLVIPGDVPLLTASALKNLVQVSDKKKCPLTFLSVKLQNPTGYGRVVRSSAGTVTQIVEEKDCTAELRQIKEINSAIYLLEQGFLREALTQLKPENAQQEYYLTDVVQIGTAKKINIEAILLSDPTEIMGANSREELLGLELIRRLHIAKKWMSEGVTFEDPESAFIEEDVLLSPDCFVGSGVHLKGRTKLEHSVVLEGGGLIVDSQIGESSRIRMGSYIESSTVGALCEVGPYAHLRPGTVLEKHVQVGNFAEVKNSRLGEGAKTHHFSYLGDSEIGAGVNIGAGTVTCNYDGKQKHRTNIESGAFIGTNSSLVAPVTIGQSAYVAAGSVITKDVPANALAVERNEQKIVVDWSARSQKQKSKK